MNGRPELHCTYSINLVLINNYQYLDLKATKPVCDRIENFDWNLNRTGFGSFWPEPEPDCKPEKVYRIRPD